MESETLRELTASERLTIEQEYKMHESWHLDDNSKQMYMAATTISTKAFGLLSIVEGISCDSSDNVLKYSVKCNLLIQLLHLVTSSIAQQQCDSVS